MSLRERCIKFLDQQQMRGIMRTGDPVSELVEFVVAETGRSADTRLEDALPLVVYFSTEEDREEFIGAVREAKPGMIARKLP